MKKILILTNNREGLYKFRRELLEEMIQHKYRVYISAPDGEYSGEFRGMGCRLIDNRYMERRGTNPVHDIRLFRYYCWLVKRLRPQVILTYTIKPNVYGGVAGALFKVPCIANVTGLGTSIENGGLLRVITLMMYKLGLLKARKIFFQNEENYRYMLSNHVAGRKNTEVIPGSGVNLEQHCSESYPKEEAPVIFTTVGRLMKDKGTDEVLETARRIKQKYPDTVFRMIGDFEEGYQSRVEQLQREGIIEYLGVQKDIHPFMAESHAIIHASYHEGMSNVLLEAAATARPVIATDVHGCIETFEPGVTGIACKAGSVDSLVKAVEKFLSLSHEQRAEMGKAGRKKMEREFDRQIVVGKYMDEIKKI